ncbi:MAG: sigma-70 family RNA polymerase sigma factor [Saprospiraceae bacterium]
MANSEDFKKKSEEELIRIITSKKINANRAFDELYRRYYGLATAVCVNIIENREDSKDIIQDTFIDMLNRIQNSNLPIVNNFRSYLYTAIRHHCYKYFKQKNQVLPEDYLPIISIEDEGVRYFEYKDQEDYLLKFPPNELKKSLLRGLIEGYPLSELVRINKLETNGQARGQIYRLRNLFKKFKQTLLKSWIQ